METIAVIDFETTGLSPALGDRPTEIAVLLVRGARVVDSYTSLMNPGMRISPFVESLTGITNAMVQTARPASTVMREVADFLADYPLVAHNASFDRGFLDAELARLRRRRYAEFLCTMRLARRLYPKSPNHKLESLSRYLKLPSAGRAHRAEADARVTASLLNHARGDLHDRFSLANPRHEELMRLQQCPIAGVSVAIRKLRAPSGARA